MSKLCTWCSILQAFVHLLYHVINYIIDFAHVYFAIYSLKFSLRKGHVMSCDVLGGGGGARTVSRPPNDQRHVLTNLLESTFGAQHLVHLYKYVPEKLSQSMSPPIIKRTLKGALRRQPVFLVVACEYLEGMLHTYPRHRALHRAYSEEYSVAEHTTNLKRRLSTIT